MTLINKIREKSGWAIGIVAASMGMFIVGADLLSSNSFLMGDNKQVVGEIAGEEISLKEFTRQFDRVKDNFTLQFNSPPPEVQMPILRETAWEQLVFKKAYQEEFDKLGIMVTDEELSDMIQGNNIDPNFASNFTNPETGEVDKNLIVQFLQNLDQIPQQKIAFSIFEQNIYENRLRTKYQNLLGLTYYVSNTEAKKEYQKQNTKADISYLYVPYASVADSAVEVSESMLEEYYSAHKDDFKKNANREIQYISFPFNPSKEDSLYVKEELSRMVTEFKNTNNDTAFVEAKSEADQNFIVANPSNLPVELNPAELVKGDVYGPFLAGDSYKIYKVLDDSEDTVYSARARHILFKVNEDASAEEKAEVRQQANEILKEIQNGADFAAMARQYGQDATRSSGGDLGWFTEGTMVKPFNDAVMRATQEGLLPQLVETNFGYHIIGVTGVKTKQKFVVASVERAILASDETVDAAYRKAGKFTKYKDADEFEAAVEQDSSLILYQALNIPKDARFINNLSGSQIREIVRWAYNEAEVGDISPIFELEDRFVIAEMIGATEKGVSTLNSVREQVKREVLKEAKQKVILEKLSGISGELEAIKEQYGNGAVVGNTNDLSLASVSLPRVGFAPKAIGTAFGLKEGHTSKPVADQNGIIIVKVDRLEEALETADYTIYKKQVAQQHGNRVATKIKEAIDKFAEVKNDLYKYY
ncbi:peptidylprolyl isomerase [Rapidithrix thailandica]|uniref:Periplasmic chaperone PpiD n=1 Tax=Rapidithrix thailandica TaxID=413964 RepID=A0AAW9RY60_9BACT